MMWQRGHKASRFSSRTFVLSCLSPGVPSGFGTLKWATIKTAIEPVSGCGWLFSLA